MLVFNNQRRSGYEEISSYSPRYYRSIKEMDAIYQLAGWLTDLMAADLENTVAFQFVDYMDEKSFSRYEAFLKIKKDPSKTLDERKTYVKAKLIGGGKISKNKIIAIVNQFVDCKCDVLLLGTELYVSMTFADDPVKYMENIRNILREKVSAHITIIYRGTDGLDIVIQLENTVTVERICHRMDFFLYSNACAVRDRHRAEVVHEEHVELEPVTIKKNLHYLDGSLFLDGNTTLDAKEWKEDIDVR